MFFFCITTCIVSVLRLKCALKLSSHEGRNLVTSKCLSYLKKKIIKKGPLRLGAVTGIPLGSPSSPVCMCVFVDSETHVSIHHPGRATGFTQVEGIIFLSTLWYPAVLSEPWFCTFTSLSVRPWAPLGLHASAVLQDWATMWYFQGYCVYERFLCVTVVKGLLLLAAKTAVRLAVKKVNFFFFSLSWSWWIPRM